MPNIANPPPWKETVEFLRNARPPGIYSKMETEKRRSARRQVVLGSAEWVKAVQDGVFADRPPIPQAPRVPAKPRRIRRQGGPGLARWNGTPCPYCRKVMHLKTDRWPTRDHVLPRARGGTLSDANTLIVCYPCNHDKSSMTIAQFVEWLRERNDPRSEIVADLLTGYGSRWAANGQTRGPCDK